MLYRRVFLYCQRCTWTRRPNPQRLRTRVPEKLRRRAGVFVEGDVAGTVYFKFICAINSEHDVAAAKLIV